MLSVFFHGTFGKMEKKKTDENVDWQVELWLYLFRHAKLSMQGWKGLALSY